MNRSEILKLLAYVRVAFPNSYTKIENSDFKALVELWERHFKDYDYNLVQCAIDSIIASDTSGFAPSIGKIKAMINKLVEPETMTEQEAWTCVYNVLKDCGMYSKREFDKLPETVRMVVGSHTQLKEWAYMNTEQLNTVVASNFMRSYRAKIKHVEEIRALPSDVKTLISGLVKKIESKE